MIDEENTRKVSKNSSRNFVFEETSRRVFLNGARITAFPVLFWLRLPCLFHHFEWLTGLKTKNKRVNAVISFLDSHDLTRVRKMDMANLRNMGKKTMPKSFFSTFSIKTLIPDDPCFKNKKKAT